MYYYNKNFTLICNFPLGTSSVPVLVAQPIKKQKNVRSALLRLARRTRPLVHVHTHQWKYYEEFKVLPLNTVNMSLMDFLLALICSYG